MYNSGQYLDKIELEVFQIYSDIFFILKINWELAQIYLGFDMYQ